MKSRRKGFSAKTVFGWGNMVFKGKWILISNFPLFGIRKIIMKRN